MANDNYSQLKVPFVVTFFTENIFLFLLSVSKTYLPTYIFWLILHNYAFVETK